MKAIEGGDFSNSRVSLIGYGGMGHHYLEALQALGVGQISVVSRSPETLRGLEGRPGLELVSGGVEGFKRNPDGDELAIVATPTDTLEELSRQLIGRGFRRLLIEKPVSLWSGGIEALGRRVTEKNVTATRAYYRVAYPSMLEVAGRVEDEGGRPPCHKTSRNHLVRLGRAVSANGIDSIGHCQKYPGAERGARARQSAFRVAGMPARVRVKTDTHCPRFGNHPVLGLRGV